MKNCMKIIAFVAACGVVSACESTPHEEYMFGAATKANAQIHAVRDVNVPNSKAVESTSGVRAARAVKALNDGQMKDVSQTSSTTTGGS